MVTLTGAKRPRRLPDLELRDPDPPPSQILSPRQYRELQVSSKSAVVIELGSSMLRAGFSSDDLGQGPRLQYPPYVTRSREATKDGLSLIDQTGHEALTNSHRSASRTPFDGNIANNSTLLERLLDGTLLRLGLGEEDDIDHPIVITEPPCQPNGVRAYFSELVFEGYRAPKLCLGIDALFSYLYHNHTTDAYGAAYRRKHGLVVSCGYHATHVLPVLHGRYQAPATKRINVGGYHLTSSLSRRLQLQYAPLSQALSYGRVEALQHDVCRVAEDYTAELGSIRDSVSCYEAATKLVKVPLGTSGNEKTALSAEEQERQKQMRVERGRRLGEMMRERNREKAAAKAAASGKTDSGPTAEESAGLHAALDRHRQLEALEGVRKDLEDVFFLGLAKLGIQSTEEFDKALADASAALDAEREKLGGKVEAAEATWQKTVHEDELLRVPDDELSAAGLKRKRHIKALRGAAEARQRLKREKEEAKQRENDRLEDIARRRAENPEQYVAELRQEREEVAAKIRKRKAERKAGSDRRSVAARERMRLLAQHAGNKGEVDHDKAPGPGSGPGSRRREKAKETDTFGMNDSDWDVYRDMRVREETGEDSDNGSAADNERLAELREEILKIDPEDEDPTLVRPVGSALLFVPHSVEDEIPMVVDRYRTPEALFQPSLLGVEQCGLSEAIELALRSFTSQDERRNIVKEAFVTGGVSATPGMRARIAREIRQICPHDWGEDIVAGVRMASDPVRDAWRGASLFAETGGQAFQDACITRADYEERGPDYLREHGMGNWYVPTPSVEVADADKKKKGQYNKRATHT